MKKQIIQLSIVPVLFTTHLYAQETSEQRDRINSVKKAVATVAKTPQTSIPSVDENTTQSAGEQQAQRKRHTSVKKAVASVSQTPTKELDVVYGFKHMFRDGKVTGQIRTLYSSYRISGAQDIYATALGGFVKYELAEFKGFSGAVSLRTSTDIDYLSGDGDKRNTELSSNTQEYDQRDETYLNYRYNKFNIRVGRQIIDTPLADSDDVRMVPNSFQAAIGTYEDENINFMFGYLQEWQGSDAGLDDGWQTTGKDGTYFGGLSYATDMLEANIWYYNINGEAGDEIANSSYYGDIVGNIALNEVLDLHLGVQYLYQKTKDNSGVQASIYGVSSELVYGGLGLNIAYNKANKQENKQSFSGFGGGTLFTNMDSMILDTITHDRDAYAVVGGVSYGIGDFNLLYAYGKFKGDADTMGIKEDIVEQNFGCEYSKTDDFTLAAIYTVDQDKYNHDANGGDWKNIRLLAAYNF